MPQTRVVIADDESLIRMHLKETLVGLGYIVVGEARDGIGAVNLARDLEPDLMIMDIKMPNLDGIRAAELLNQERRVPVMLLSAYDERNLVEKAVDSGVIGYLVKPFREADLMPSIEIAMNQFAQMKARDRQLDELKEAMETRKLLERAKGILMRSQKLTDADATQRIDALAESTGKSSKEIAEAVILRHQLERSSAGPE